MYHALKTMISAGNYKLAEIQSKIKKLYVMGDLTEGQTDELLVLASGGVSVDAERPAQAEMIDALIGEIAALKERVAALERGGSDGNTDAGEKEEPTYPAWKPWDYICKDYQPGAVVSHNGTLWKSIHPGQNVWEPGTAGAEALWAAYTGEV